MELFNVFFEIFVSLFSLELAILLFAIAIAVGIVLLIKKVVYF